MKRGQKEEEIQSLSFFNVASPVLLVTSSC